MLERKDRGLTLVEVLVAVVILGFVALLLSRTLTTASAVLTKTSEGALQSQEIMRWIRLVRQDVQSSKELIVYGKSYPATATTMCSSVRSLGSPASSWESLGAANAGTRALMTMQVQEVQYDRGNASSPNTWVEATTLWVGYEVRSRFNAGAGAQEFSLWRVECGAGAAPVAAPVYQEEISNLDVGIPPSISGLDIISCPSVAPTNGVSTLEKCPEAVTTAKLTWYSLMAPPWSVTGSGGRLKSGLIFDVRRMVDA